MDRVIPCRYACAAFPHCGCEVEYLSAEMPMRRRHEWALSRVGHGEAQCIHCLMTNREAWVLGEFCING